VTSQRGDGFAWERSPAKLRKYLVVALIDNCWISPPCPDRPLFGEATDGTLNLRGSYALQRYEADR
jgi:hypothetical protein